MHVNMAMHDASRVTVSAPVYHVQSDYEGGPFWEAEIRVTGEDGKRFSLSIFGKTRESVTMNAE